jgi:hypothetical protein
VPTFNAKKIHNFGADQVVEITAVDENGEQGNPHNSTWYKINGEGYTYSGWVQPVETNYQKPILNLPEKGQLREIAVPFCDTKKEPYVYAERLSHLLWQYPLAKEVIVTRRKVFGIRFMIT